MTNCHSGLKNRRKISKVAIVHPNATVVWISHEPTQIQRLLAIGTSHWTMADGQLSNHKLTVDSKALASVSQGNQP